MNQPLLGAHVSIAGGLNLSIKRGEELGATAIQTFASSPRTLSFKPVEPEIIKLYLEEKAQSSIKLHVFHGIYLINLAHEDASLRTKAVESLIAYQQLAGSIGALGTVFHTGSHKGNGLNSVLPQIIDSLAQVLQATPPNVVLMLENTAGQGGAIGQSIKDLALIFATLQQNHLPTGQLGICLDTQHAFASGIPLHTPEGLDDLLNQIDTNLGLDKLMLLHLNDSEPEFNAKKDRHANLGEGNIGLNSFKNIINHPKLAHLPMILEVPGINKSGPRKQDVALLQSLLT